MREKIAFREKTIDFHIVIFTIKSKKKQRKSFAKNNETPEKNLRSFWKKSRLFLRA